jgi:integrase
MASVFKRKADGKKDGKKLSIYTAQFYITDPETGKLVKMRKSTGETNKTKALAKAIEMERLAQGVMPSDGDKVQQMKNMHSELGQEIARETITSVSLRKFFSSMMQILTGEEMQIITIESWCNEWLARKERDSGKATMARYKGHVKAFLSWIGDNAVKPLETLTTGDVERWKRHLLDQGIAGKTAMSYLKDLGQIYRAAVRDGLISFSPVGAVTPPSTDDSQERRPFTAEEVSQLIKAAPSKQWGGMILAAAFTGLRLGDVARLQWSSVSLETKMIELMPSKTKRKKRIVSIPIQPDLLAYLTAAPVVDDSPDAFVFPDLAQLGIGSRAGLSQTFNSIMETARVDRGKPSRQLAEGESKGKGRITYERGFHSLRHTFATWLRVAGVTEEDRMFLMGQSSRDVHAKYAHADESVSRNAMAKLSSLKETEK